jgi:hypothetical protein
MTPDRYQYLLTLAFWLGRTGRAALKKKPGWGIRAKEVDGVKVCDTK